MPMASCARNMSGINAVNFGASVAGIRGRLERKGQGEMALTDGATHKGFSLLIM